MFSMRRFAKSPKPLVTRSSLRFERLETRDVPAQWLAIQPDTVTYGGYGSADLSDPSAVLTDAVGLGDTQYAPTLSVLGGLPADPPLGGGLSDGATPVEFFSVDEKDRPAPPEGMDAHKWELGWDPAKKKYVESEAETALRLEQQQGVKLKRYFPKDPKEKGDFVDEKGVVYDGCSPPKTEFFDNQWDNYKKSLDEHLAHPTVDKVVIDTTGLALTEAQLKQLDDYIKSLPKDKQDKIVRIK